MLETKKSRGAHGEDIHSAETKQRASRGQSGILVGIYTGPHEKVGDGWVSGVWDTTSFREQQENQDVCLFRGCVLYIDGETI